MPIWTWSDSIRRLLTVPFSRKKPVILSHSIIVLIHTELPVSLVEQSLLGSTQWHIFYRVNCLFCVSVCARIPAYLTIHSAPGQGNVVINGFMHAGWLPTNTVTTYAMQIGSAIEIVLLSWTLADRMAILKQKKEESQKVHLDQLTQNYNALKRQVVERTSELEKANIELKELAARDELTGLLNHVAFVEQFKHIIEDALRYEYYLSVLLIDIDNFKLVNDTFGHLLGNEV